MRINNLFEQFQGVSVILKKFEGFGENVEFRSGSKWAFKFLRYIMVLRFLNDLDRLEYKVFKNVRIEFNRV